MKIVSNDKLIKRNQRIGQYTTFAGLIILAIGFYFSVWRQELFHLSIGALILGFILTQVSLYYGNRFGRSPRPDELLTKGLKGLDNQYTLYHYTTPVSHLLVGPAGIWILVPYHQGGTILYDETKERWKQKGGNLYLRFFAQDSLGRPDQDIIAYQHKLNKFFTNEWLGENPPAIQVALVFTNKNAIVNAENAPVATLPIKKLKDFIRKVNKQEPIPEELFKKTQALLPDNEE